MIVQVCIFECKTCTHISLENMLLTGGSLCTGLSRLYFPTGFVTSTKLLHHSEMSSKPSVWQFVAFVDTLIPL